MGILKNLHKLGGGYNKNKLDRAGVYLVQISDGGVVKTTRNKNAEGDQAKRFNPDLEVLEVLSGDDDSHKQGEICALQVFEGTKFSQYFIRDMAGITRAVGEATGEYEPAIVAELDEEEEAEYVDDICDKLFFGDGSLVKEVPFVVQVSKNDKGYTEYLFKSV